MKQKGLMPVDLQMFSEQEESKQGVGCLSTNQKEAQIITQNNKSSGKKQVLKAKVFTRADVAKMLAAEMDKAKQSWNKELEAKQKEAIKLAKMSMSDQFEYDRIKLQEKIAEVERRENLLNMTEIARELISSAGANPTKEMLAVIVSEDVEKTSNNAKIYLKAMESEREAIKRDFENFLI